MVKEFKILFLDDDQMIRKLFLSFFSAERSGTLTSISQDGKEQPYLFDVTCKASGDEGIAAVEEACAANSPYAVAFIDLRMPPGIDGIETATRIRAKDPDIEIVIVTGDRIVNLSQIHTAVQPLHKLLLLNKPFTMLEIQQTVLSLSEKWAALRDNRQLIAHLESAVDVSYKEIVKTKDNYREIFENTNELILSMNLDGVILFANPIWEKLFGYADTQRQDSILDFVEAQKRGKFSKLLEGVIHKKSELSVETTLIGKSGEKIYVEGSILPRIRDGEIVGLSIFFRNVSDLIRVETALTITTDNLRKIFLQMIQTLTATVEIRDPYTAGHQVRVANICHKIATELKLKKNSIEGLYIAGLLHDIGKISIPADILSKPGKLSESEFNLIIEHVSIGYTLLKNIEFPWPVEEYLLQHHERNDGSGYPNGLKQDEISLESKILIVADVVEAISSHRPYRPARGIEEAIKVIIEGKGTLFDPGVVDACVRILSKKDFAFNEDMILL